MNNLLEKKCYFVLSTGRTGTTFLYDLLKQSYPELSCFQEPSPGWLFNLYSNFYCERRLGIKFTRFIQGHFLTTRNRLLKNSIGDYPQYIEINPFLYGLGDLLRESLGEIQILHMIRHPFEFIRSMLNFRPRTWRAHFVHAPFWNLDVSRALNSKEIKWHQLSPIEKKAWQWVFINQRIQSYKKICQQFLLIRYEDLFTSENSEREEQLKKIFAFLGLKLVLFPPAAFQTKVNPSQTERLPPWNQWNPKTIDSVLQICGPLMAEYHYSIP